MGSSSERNQLFQIFHAHQKDIYETFQLYEKPSDTSLQRIGWDKVLEMGDAISRQATIVGMIWTGESPEFEEVEENMGAYVNTLNGFLLTAFGASVGAGPTMLSYIRASVKKVLDASFLLMKESIASYGACTQNDRTIPQLAGKVWEACSDLQKIPSTNITAIGRSMTKVAVSVKDVIRELNELKTGPAEPEVKVQGESSPEDSLGADLGNDLSPEEMKNAQEAISSVSGVLAMMKELLRSVTALIQFENRSDTTYIVVSLEKVLKECQTIGPQVDELGACLYPPQETSAIRAALNKISCSVENISQEMQAINGASEGFIRVCNDLKSSLVRLNAELDRSAESEVGDKIQGIELDNH